MAVDDGSRQLVQNQPNPGPEKTANSGHASQHSCCDDDQHCRHHEDLPHDSEALISARNLRFARGGRDLIVDVSIDIHSSEIVTLIGPNGAGKTTLAKLLLNIEQPDGGSIVRRPQLKIGYVPQRFDVDRTLPMTVANFLSFGLSADHRDVSEVLSEVGAIRLAGHQLANLSGGETQRVLIARSLVRKPELMVLDEPARGVDHVGETELYDLIGRLRDRHGLGILLVSHDLHVVMAKSDRVLCLNQHICCSGLPETVKRHPEYVRLFGPRAAETLAVYTHHHDHAHDLSGQALDSPGQGEN